MSSFYFVVQYVPNPQSGERVNVGVLVVSGQRFACRFVQNWTRTQRFGREDIHFLRDFAEHLADLERKGESLPWSAESGGLALAEWAAAWNNSIQVTEPRASLEDLHQLLSRMFELLVQDAKRKPPSFRDHRHAVQITTEAVTEAVEHIMGVVGSRDLVRRNPEIEGKATRHNFDVAVWNGRPLLAAQAMSFEGGEIKKLRSDIDAAAFGVIDVRAQYGQLDFAAVLLPPTNRSSAGFRDAFDRAQQVFSSVGAAVVHAPDAKAWASTAVSRYRDYLVGS